MFGSNYFGQGYFGQGYADLKPRSRFTTRLSVDTARSIMVPWYQSGASAGLSGASNYNWHHNLSRSVATTYPGTNLPASFGTAPGGATYDRTTSGALAIPNASAGHLIRCVRVRANGPTNIGSASQEAQIFVCDRLLDVAIDQTSTSAQTLNTGTLPSRCANGWGIMALEANATLAGAGAVVASVSYTNQSGTSGRTASINTGTSLWPIFKNGTMLLMPLQAGDYRVQSIQSITLTNASSTAGAGKLALVIYEPAFHFDFQYHVDANFSVGGPGDIKDWLQTALVGFDPLACLELHYHCDQGTGNTGSTTLFFEFEMVID